VEIVCQVFWGIMQAVVACTIANGKHKTMLKNNNEVNEAIAKAVAREQ